MSPVEAELSSAGTISVCLGASSRDRPWGSYCGCKPVLISGLATCRISESSVTWDSVLYRPPSPCPSTAQQIIVTGYFCAIILIRKSRKCIYLGVDLASKTLNESEATRTCMIES